jgi:hypothetical protein
VTYRMSLGRWVLVPDRAQAKSCKSCRVASNGNAIAINERERMNSF